MTNFKQTNYEREMEIYKLYLDCEDRDLYGDEVAEELSMQLYHRYGKKIPGTYLLMGCRLG